VTIMKALNTKKRSGSRGSGGSRRSISKVKRGNQRRQKLIKKGKLKPPNSTSTFVKAQEAKGDEARRLREERKRRKGKEEPVKVEEKAESEEEDEVDGEEMMDLEDALLLTKNKGHKKNQPRSAKEEENEDERVERLALERQAKRVKLNEQEEDDTEEKALLPTKTKDGKLVTQIVKVKKKQMVEEEEDEEEPQENGLKNHEEARADHSSDAAGENESKPRSVVSILAEREEVLEEFKLKLGATASAFLELPEERISHLEKLVATLTSVPVQIPVIGFTLAATTVAEVLKDIIPAYKISHHDNQDTILKKETLRLQGYELGILRCAKEFLVKMEGFVRQRESKGSPKRLCSLRCICDIMSTHPQFNFSHNILKLVVPCLNEGDPQVRSLVNAAVRRVFKEDKRGDISLAAVRYFL